MQVGEHHEQLLTKYTDELGQAKTLIPKERYKGILS